MLLLVISLLLSILAYAGSSWLGRKDLRSVSGFTAKMLSLLLITPLLMLLPKWQIELHSLTPISTNALADATVNAFPYGKLALFLWLAGCFILLVRHLTHHFAMLRLKKASSLYTGTRSPRLLSQTCQQIQLRRIPALMMSRDVKSPVVTGLLHPTILLPHCAQSWSDNTLSMVLCHECTHVKRKDLWLHTAAQICCAIYWFNPLVWLLHRRLRNACEFSCDAEIIASGTDAKCYIYALCDVAESLTGQNHLPATVLAMADTSSLHSRVSHLLKNPPHRRPFLTMFLLSFSICSCVTLAIVRPTEPLNSSTSQDESGYSTQEVVLRHSADPFPGDQ